MCACSEIRTPIAPDDNPSQHISGIGGAAFLLHILALLRMPVAYLAIVRQECRTSYQFLLNAQNHAARSINLIGLLYFIEK